MVKLTRIHGTRAQELLKFHTAAVGDLELRSDANNEARQNKITPVATQHGIFGSPNLTCAGFLPCRQCHERDHRIGHNFDDAFPTGRLHLHKSHQLMVPGDHGGLKLLWHNPAQSSSHRARKTR